jgi:hypothetical protein
MKTRSKSLLLAAVALWMTGSPSHAQLKSLDGPKGGQIVYGPVDGADSPAAAMGSILRSLHNQYGDRPQLGRVFKVRGTNSDAVFFTLVKRDQNNMQIAGMLIAAPVGPRHVEAALLSDEASRFGTSINPMLQTLFASWQLSRATGIESGGSSSGGSGGGTAAPVEPTDIPADSATARTARKASARPAGNRRFPAPLFSGLCCGSTSR